MKVQIFNREARDFINDKMWLQTCFKIDNQTFTVWDVYTWFICTESETFLSPQEMCQWTVRSLKTAFEKLGIESQFDHEEVK